ncbi:Cytochrome P450 98A2 [Bienertia sinuspersici]
MVLLSLAFIPSFFIIIYLAFRRIQRLRFRLPPGPTPWPIVGNIFNLKPVHFKCFYEWAQYYGPIISFDLAKKVLKHHDQELANRCRSRSQANFTKDGMDLTWADYGPHYVKVRKICTVALFTSKKIEAQRPIRFDEVTTMIESIYKDYNNSIGENAEEIVITLRKYLVDVALNHITRITFGKRFRNSEGELDEQGQEFMRLILGVRETKRPSMVVEHVSWLRWMSRFYDTPLNEHRDRMDRFAKEIMEEEDKQHFVNALLSCKDEYGLSEETIIGLLWDMVMAGMDTIAITVEWAMAELLRHPRVIQKAHHELDRTIGHERNMVEEDLENLPYLQAIIKESLRMHPPTPLMLPHKASCNIKIEGYDIPKGTTILVNVWAIARDPNIWIDPHEFRPERFLEEDVTSWVMILDCCHSGRVGGFAWVLN